jgi:hypothetical protein
MNEIKIITELCPEDRDRIDRLTGVMEALVRLNTATAKIPEPDDIQKALAEQVAKSQKAPTEAPTEATGAAKAGTPATDHPAEESLPWGDPAPVEEPKPVVTMADVQQAVILKVRAGKKPEVEAIVKSYAERVSGIPEDKLAECLERLNALEVGA